MTPREVLLLARQTFERAVEEHLPALFPTATEWLFAKANQSDNKPEQIAAHQARYYLQERKELLSPKIMFFLRGLLDRSLDTAYQQFQTKSALQSTGLSLLGESEFEGTLSFMNMIQRLRDCGGQELNELNLRITGLFGQSEIKERENPFRPYILANSLSEAVETMRFEPLVSKILKFALAESMAQHVSSIYRLTNHTLQAQGVEAKLSLRIAKQAKVPAGSGVVSVAHYKNQSEAAFTGVRELHLHDWLAAIGSDQVSDTEKQLPAPLMWLSPHATLGEAVRKVFGKADIKFSDGNAQSFLKSEAASGSGAQALPERLMPYLRELQSQGAFTSMTPALVSRSVLVKILGKLHKKNSAEGSSRIRKLREYRDDLTLLCERSEQKMALDVVIALSEAWQRDLRIPELLREKLNTCDFLIAQLALMDNSWFLAARHPARLMLNRIASVLTGVRGLSGPEIYFQDEVSKIFKTLARHDCEVPGLFERIFARLDASLEKDLRNLDRLSRRSVRVLSEAQLRFSDSQRLRLEIAEVLNAVPGFSLQFRSFLESEWVRAIVIASRKDTELLRSFCEFVPWIIWAIQPKSDDAQRATSRSYFPDLMHILRQGFGLLELNTFRQNALYSWLNDIHERNGQQLDNAALTFDDWQLRFTAVREFQAHLRNETDLRLHFSDVQPFIQVAADEIELPVRYLSEENQQSQQMTQSPFMKTKKAEEAEIWLDRLQPGCSFELFQAGEWRRMCVIWRDQLSCAWLVVEALQPHPFLADFALIQSAFQRGAARLTEPEEMMERSIQRIISAADSAESA